ncbi:calcium channel protein, partial [Cryomyces antarcticus]
ERQGRRSHRRTLSDKGRSILRNSESLLGRTGFGRRYAPIEESSPSPPHTNPVSPRAYITTPSGTHLPADDTEDGSFSPMADRGGFQEAMGFAGLSFHGEANDGETSSEPPIRANRSSLPILVTSSESSPLTTQHDVEDSPDYFSSLYADTTPLTDSTRLHAHSGRGSTTPTGQRHDRERSSFQSVRFLTPDISPGSRPGDNLSNIEAGVSDGAINRSGSSKRSLSPSSAESPLHRAGTIVKKMSQRVVNLSNEPEIVERSIRRRSSVKQPRLDEHSPALPPVTDYNSDGAASMRSPTSEKLPSPILGPADTKPWEPPSNPLKGKSMGIFPPESKLRKRLCDLLVHPATEPFILVLIVIQTVLLAVDASRSVFDDPRSQRWGTSWIDYGLLGLFAIYTIEAVVRVIVSGFIINPEEYSTIDRQVGFRQAVLNKFNELFALHKQTTLKHVILRSLKRAAPTLLNVAFLIGFFWLLFAIIGVQSFKSSLRRTCVWVDPDGLQSNFTSNFQFCGGYLDQNGHSMPWLTADGRNGSDVHKGYICPQQSVCIEGDNPYNGTVSFDNILQSLELVFVMMTSNTFSDLLYYLTDSDYLTAALCEPPETY